MKMLCAGFESERRVELLVSLTGITSEAKVQALKKHLCDRKPLGVAADLCGTDRKNLDKALAALEAVTAIYEELKTEEGVTKVTRETL